MVLPESHGPRVATPHARGDDVPCDMDRRTVHGGWTDLWGVNARFAVVIGVVGMVRRKGKRTWQNGLSNGKLKKRC